MTIQNQEQLKITTPKLIRSKWSNKTWVLICIGAFVLCFALARVWVTYGFCIPCYVEAIWNGIQSWIKTGVFPFW